MPKQFTKLACHRIRISNHFCKLQPFFRYYYIEIWVHWGGIVWVHVVETMKSNCIIDFRGSLTDRRTPFALDVFLRLESGTETTLIPLQQPRKGGMDYGISNRTPGPWIGFRPACPQYRSPRRDAAQDWGHREGNRRSRPGARRRLQDFIAAHGSFSFHRPGETQSEICAGQLDRI